MKALYNEEIVNINKVMIPPGDRGFQYGDGFFEYASSISTPSVADFKNRRPCHHPRIRAPAFLVLSYPANQF